ncbi:MAG: sodium:proton antiporter [Coriobacteriales bacterium]|nr:sodium:proton antiporter [Coriobacteriales bacterium]
MLGAVLASNFISVQFPRILTPLVQIAIGVGLTLLPISFEITFDPELFMVLFIAPLLFEDAKKVDKPSLWRLKFPVLWLALGLVFCTVLVLGFSINIFAPSIPLAAAFALAAALAPTDAVSVGSLRKSANISNEQSLLLRGEALLNDASSIVSFQFAIAAAITGTFSLLDAGTSFLISFVGGLGVGLGLMLLRFAFIRFLRSRGIDSISFYVLFELITPFLVFLVAELIGVSGIIAVVAAGIAHSFSPRTATPAAARQNIVSTSVWSVLSFTLNGLVFLMLGTQLRYVIERVWTGTAADTNYLIWFVVLILAVILILRFICILVMHRNVDVGQGGVELAFDESASAPLYDLADPQIDDTLYDLADPQIDDTTLLAPGFGTMSAEEREVTVAQVVQDQREKHHAQAQQHRQARRAAAQAEKRRARAAKNYWPLHLHDALLLSLTGVKGAITLAVVLTIPLTLGGATAFPERDLILFLASGVILLSLLMANILVPLIAPQKQRALRPQSELQAILGIYRTVVRQLSGNSKSRDKAAVDVVIQQYFKRINTLKTSNSLENPRETQVFRYAIELERDNTNRLIDEGRVSAFTGMVYLNQLSHQLARAEHHSTVGWEVRGVLEQLRHQFRQFRTLKQLNKSDESRNAGITARFEYRELQTVNIRHVISKLRSADVLEKLGDKRAGTDTSTDADNTDGVDVDTRDAATGTGADATDATRKDVDLQRQAIEAVIQEFEQKLVRLENLGRFDRKTGSARLDARLQVEAEALDLERVAISDALGCRLISAQTAKKLHDNVAAMELDIEDQLG